ncbi:MAG TPA: hypothetical protein VIV60_08780, partial [Polyangiaceae bacterium]
MDRYPRLGSVPQVTAGDLRQKCDGVGESHGSLFFQRTGSVPSLDPTEGITPRLQRRATFRGRVSDPKLS